MRASRLIGVTLGVAAMFVFAVIAQAQSTNLAVTVRHAPSLNGNGRIEGSLQQMLGENVTLNGGFVMTGDLLVPGTPTLLKNGNPTFAGTVVGSGNTSPTGYQITLNGNCSLHYLRTRTTPVSVPAVAAPPQPAGTRSVTINSAGQSYGDPTTLRDLTLNGNVGLVSVPPGTYGAFTVNGGSGLVLGVAGGLQAVNYNLQNLNLNGNSTLKVVGPVILTVANGFTANGTVGASNNPAWLQLQVASGGFTLNGGCTVGGLVLAPNGTVIVNGNSTLVGTSTSDQFTLNGGGLVRWGDSAAQTNQPPVATPQSITLAENSSTNITLTGSDPQGRTLTFSLLTLPSHGTANGTPPNVTYKPNTNYYGSDTFTFKVNNGITDSSPATVSLTITQVYYPPTAFSQSLTNFEDTALPVTLTGYDPQGYALTYSVLTQPAHGSLSGTTSHLTYQPATNYFGNDSFTFRVNDGVSNSVAATISITNRPVDDPPRVVAGPDQLIILPANSVSLAGSVTYDVFPGTVDTVVWSKVSGSGNVAFSNPSNTLTTATFSQSGVYQLRLFASDSFLSGSSDLFVTVDAPPVVSAGPAMTNTFPVTVTLSGTASDDGLPTNGTLTVVWSMVSGPGTVIFSQPSTLNPQLSFSTNGVYVLRLTADDGIATNHSDVTVIENLPPVVNAGANILTNGLQAVLNGSVADDGLPGAFLTSQWSQSTGPGTITFGNASATNTTVTASESGTYILTLTATDGAVTSSNEVVVTFNLPPVVNAGPDQTVNFGATVTLAGTATDDQLPHDTLTSTWTEVSGPGSATFADASLTNATVTFDQPGIYTLRLTASDTLATTSADVVIRVNAAPVVEAGANQTIQLGQSANLQGSVSDDGLPEGGTLSAAWVLVSGPGQLTFDDPYNPETSVRFSMAGTYVLRLTANDGLATNFSDTTITVNSANQPPVVHVGPKQLVVLPAGANLTGSVTDDGLPAGGALTLGWSKTSGPGSVVFSAPGSTNTAASFSAAGDYVLRLTANDSALSGYAEVKVVVRTPAMNQAPVVSAGPDKVIGLTNVAALDGAVTDDGLPQGSSVTVNWSVVSGPGTVTFENSSVTNAQATFSVVGTYKLRLTASDSALSASSDVTVTVYPYNQPPVVDAGPDQTIVVPDPDILISSGLMPTNPSVEMSQSLLSVPHWNNAVGQPGLDDTTARKGLSWSGTALFASGNFFHSGTNYIGQVGRWDGTNWSGLYDPDPAYPGGPPYGYAGGGLGSIAAFNDDVYIEGGFLGPRWPGPGITSLRWDGQHWLPWECQTEAYWYTGGQVLATSNKVYLTAQMDYRATYARDDWAWDVGNGYIYHPTNVYTPDVDSMPVYNGITVWDGTNWGSLGDGIGAWPYDFPKCVAVGKHGEVYVGGMFQFSTPTGMATNIAVWNGTNWTPLGGGITGGYFDDWGDWEAPTVDSLAVDDEGNLYAVGEFQIAGGLVVNNIAKWDGTNWSALGQGDDVGINGWGYPAVVAAYGRDVYVAGLFNHAGDLDVNSIARWNGQKWLTLGQGAANGVNGWVWSLTASSRGVYVGGWFTYAGGLPANHVAFWEYPEVPSRGAVLQGRVSDDGLPVGSVLTSVWAKTSGPGDVTFDDLHNPVTTATFSKAGTYVLRLSASDGEYTSTDDTTVIVHGNEPPVVNAGADQAIGFGEVALMAGTVSDDGLPEGMALEQEWTVLNGPGTVTFDDPSDPETAVTFSQPGVYVLRLSANDTIFTTHSEVTIQVLSQNSAPSVQARADNSVIQPDAANLYGDISDDGLPTAGTLTWCWSQVSGPGAVVFANACSNDTSVLFPVVGTYVLRLTASDSQLSSSADVTVQVVAPGAGQPPIVIAGPEQHIVLPAIATLNGIVITNGPIDNSRILWSVLNGPGTVTFADPSSPSTTAGFNTPGIYELQLELDQEWFWWYYSGWSALAADYLFVIVDPPAGANQAPIVHAGPTHYVPLGTPAALNGAVSDDGLPVGASVTSTWTMLSGPGPVVFGDSNAPATTALFAGAGQYVLQLSATDSELSGADTVTFNVYDPAIGIQYGNNPPVVDAGPPQTVSAFHSITLAGSVTDDGLPYGVLNYSWSQVNGPVPASFDNAGSLNSAVYFSYPGAYVLRLTADDGQYANGADVTITVTPCSNHPPVVDAGPWRTIYLPTNTADMAAVVSDDGLPAGGTLACQWSLASGGPVTFSDSNSLNPTVTFVDAASAAGDWGAEYDLTLTVTDGELTNSATTKIFVANPASGDLPPVVDAGPDQTITFPTAAQLAGTVSDDTQPFGYFYSYWQQISGPAPVTFDDNYNPQTPAHFVAPGTYVLRLGASDFVTSASDDVVITVNPATDNQPPTVNAGPSRTVLVGAPVVLRGWAKDDGLPNGVLTTTWEFVDGPAPVQFSDPASLATTVVFGGIGQYNLQLRANDSELESVGGVTITVVSPPGGNQPPVVDAGPDQTLGGTGATTQLHGTVTDDGLPNGVLNHAWRQISGPGSVTFGDPNPPTTTTTTSSASACAARSAAVMFGDPNALDTTATFSDRGDYVLGLRADDGSLATEDYVVIHIDHPVNQPPTVDAGQPRTILLPTNSLTLNGTVTDDGLPAGGTLSHHWEVERADGDVVFDDTNSLTPTVTFSNPQIDYTYHYMAYFQFRLVADDSEFTNSSDVLIMVGDPALGHCEIEVDAGPDQTITWPALADLNGSTIPENLGESPAQWLKISGPGMVTFDNENSPQTTAHFSKPGVYVLRLQDINWFGSGADDVTITVLPPTNHLHVETGPALCVPIQHPTTTLNGSVTDDALPANATLTAAWSMVSGPGNVTFADASMPATLASFDAVGIYVLRLTANDSVLTNSSDLTVKVYDPTGTLIVDAGAAQTVVLPQTAALNGVVSDYGVPGAGSYLAGALSYSWSVVSGPYQVDFADGGSLHATAHFYVSGDYVLRLTASDGVLTSSADVGIHVVSLANQPPQVFLNSPAPVAMGVDANFSGIVLDDGRPVGGALTVQWSVVSGPGMATFIQSSNNFPRVSTIANFSAVGDYVLQLAASDGELSTTGRVTITVFDLYQGNQPPVVNAGPNRTATTRYPITLQGTASDDGLPAGGALSTIWSVNSGPGEVRFSNAAQTNTTANFYLAGTYVLQLSASDGQLNSVSQVIITVNDPTNEPPSVYAGPAQTITRPAAALLNGVVLDDGLPLGYPLTYRWTKVSGPGNVTFIQPLDFSLQPSTNATLWLDVDYFDASASATFSANGTYVLRLTASDTQFTNTDDITIVALPGVNTAPQVDAGPDQSIVLPNAAFLHTGVTDDGLPNGTLEINWSVVSGPGPVSFNTVNGVYRAVFTTSGAYTLRLTAGDGEFTSTDDVNVTVYDPTQAPVVQISLPLDGAIITSPTNVIGTASSTILQSYVLEYRLKPADDSLSASGGEGQGEVAWSVLASNTVSVVNGPLGVLDPTLALNGIYELRLTATDISGRTATTDPITVIFDRNLKIGQFTISFNDLAVPVPGLPLQVTRTYDSRAAAAGVQGDFGIGWTMDIRNVRLQKNRPLSRNWEEYTTGSADDLSLVYHLDPGNPRYVTITFPDGRVEKFQFNPYPLDQWALPIDYPQWNFTPIGNTRGTLEPASFEEEDGNFLYFAGAIPGIADLYDLNYFYGWFDSTNTLADLQRYPTLFRYTSPEGYKYLIDEIEGLKSVTDPNGNTLLISPNGLTWTNSLSASTQDPGLGTNNPSLSIAFQRDDLGRITNIVDVAGNSLGYQYDTNGNLVTFTDRTGQTNGFAYTNPAFPHYLTSITDARGITPVQNVFDADGRLIGSLDALGNAISYGHDLANNLEFVTNRLGAVTIRQYDNNGNVISMTDPLGLVTHCTYDEDCNLLSEGKGANPPRIYTYDAQDNRVLETDELGRTRYYTYNVQHKVLTATDPDGHTTTNSYDASGNLLATSDPLGNTFTFTYDDLGNVLSMTDPQGHVTSYTYDGLGHLSSETDPLGNVTTYVADTDGKLLSKTQTRTVPANSPVQKFKLLKAAVIAKANVSDANQLVTNITTYTYRYDASGNLVALGNNLIWDTNVYDGCGRIITRIDALGRSTIVEHNTNGLTSRITHPGGIIEQFDYDAENHLTSYVDGLGRKTQYAYNARGAVVEVTHPDGRVVTATYNDLGQLSAETDFSGTTTYAYDLTGNRISATDPKGRTASYEYNSKRACTKYTDFAGRTMTMEYDFLNRNTKVTYPDGTTRLAEYYGKLVSSITDQLGNKTQYTYDGKGCLLSVTDPMGHATAYTYDGIGNRLTESDPLGRITAYTYDDARNLTKVLMPDGSARSGTYDAMGRLLSQTDGEGKTTSFKYDDADNLTSITDPAGQVTTMEYNLAHQRTKRTDPDGAVTTWTYDSYGRLAQTQYPDYTTETLEYDSNSRLVASTDRSGHRTTYAYDDIDHVKSVTLPAGTTSFTYDDAGNRLSLTDVAGHTTQFDYDAMNRRVGVHYPDNTSVGFTYDHAGRLVAQTDQMGFITQFEYDNANRKTKATDPLQRITQYNYDACNQLTSLVDPQNLTTAFDYDNAGRRVKTTLPNATTSSTVYDKRGLMLQSKDPLGNTRSFTYDDLGRVSSATDPLGGVTLYEYDKMGRVKCLTDPKGQKTDFTYDVMGQRTAVTTPDGATRSCSYDAAGHVLTETDPLNHTTTYTYDFITGKRASVKDALNNTTSYTYDKLGHCTSMTDALGRVTSYTYDDFGRLTQITHPDNASESFKYDKDGHLTSVKDALGRTTTYGYDDVGQLISKVDALNQTTSYGYDLSGRRVSTTDPAGRQTGFGYDSVGNVTGITFADGTSVSRTCDSDGRVTSVTDQKGIATGFTYDALGHLTQVKNALGAATTYGYDELGRLTSQADALKNVTSYEYDAMGRRTRRTLPSGVFESNTYDLAGNLIQRTDFNGRKTSYGYDEINRLISETPDASFNEPPVNYHYDPVSARIGMEDLAGSTSYSYDNRDRLTTKTRTWNDTGTAATLNYGYDLDGNVIQVNSSVPNGASVSYEYDAINRLKAVNDAATGSTRYGYDSAGNIGGIVHPNGVTETVQCDTLNRVTSIVANLSSSSMPLSQFACTYDMAGNRMTSDESVSVNGLTNSITRSYGYDAGYRLINETVSVNNQLSVVDYTYDAVGNRTVRNSTLPSLPSYTNAYDADDRLTSDQYDANGNTIAATMLNAQQQSISCNDSYDYADRLIQRQTTLNSQPATLSFQYDGDGMRVGKTVNGVTTHFMVDDVNPTGYPQVLEEHSVPGGLGATPEVTRVYTYGNGPISQDQLINGQWQASHFGRDAHGSVRLLTDDTGQATDAFHYDAFGNMIDRTGSTPTTRLFAGEEFDPDLGMHFLRARYQDPQRGRFWTRDSFEGSISDPASQHSYAYCQNDPVNGIDPSGHDDLCSVSIGMGIGFMMQPALNNLMSGTMASVNGLLETEKTKATSQAEAMMIQSTAQGTGVMMGQNNYWSTMQGAPFLLAWNPFVAPTPSLVMAPVVIGFDHSVPLYGAGLRNSVLEPGSPNSSGMIDPDAAWTGQPGKQNDPAQQDNAELGLSTGGLETKLAAGLSDSVPEAAADMAASVSIANRSSFDTRAMLALELPKGAPTESPDPMLVSVSSLTVCGPTPANYAPAAIQADPAWKKPLTKAVKCILNFDQATSDPYSHAIRTGLSEGVENFAMPMMKFGVQVNAWSHPFDPLQKYISAVAMRTLNQADEAVEEAYTSHSTSFNTTQGYLYAYSEFGGYAGATIGTFFIPGGQEEALAPVTTRLSVLAERYTPTFLRWGRTPLGQLLRLPGIEDESAVVAAEEQVAAGFGKTVVGSPANEVLNQARQLEIAQQAAAGHTAEAAEQVVGSAAEGTVDAMTGRMSGQIVDASRLDRLEGILSKNNTTLIRNADAYLDSQGAGALFKATDSGAQLFVRSDATQFELYHELKHFGDYNRLGFEAYRDLGRLGREESVFNYLKNQNWMTSEEMDSAYRYISRLRGW